MQLISVASNPVAVAVAVAVNAYDQVNDHDLAVGVDVVVILVFDGDGDGDVVRSTSCATLGPQQKTARPQRDLAALSSPKLSPER